jgi:sRNA-binding carbon storage regulator CsrA
MLVLTRYFGKKKAEIQIETPTGDIIKIKALRGGGQYVKIGIGAPTGYKILRTELLDNEGEYL